MKNLCFPFALFILFLQFSHDGSAQKSGHRNGLLGFQSHYGTFLTQSPKAAYIRDSYTFYNELYYQQQTDGQKPWHAANRFPQWGMAVFYGGTGSRRYMGNMAAVFPFINIPLVKKKSFTSKLRAGMGLGWVQKPYDKANNHKNVLIGSHLNGYMGFLWQNEIKVTGRLYVNAGFSFSHLSNGGSTLPNLGLNMPAATVGLRYGSAEKMSNEKTPRFQKTKLQYALYASGGVKQAPWVESSRYLVNTFSAEGSKQFGYSNFAGGGVIVYYDRSLEVHPAGIPSLKRKGNFLQAGVFALYEHRFGNLSVPLQLGAYVYNKDLSPQLFQNLGLRYRVAKHWSAQVILKTHMGQADHIHAGVGFTF